MISYNSFERICRDVTRCVRFDLQVKTYRCPELGCGKLFHQKRKLLELHMALAHRKNNSDTETPERPEEVTAPVSSTASSECLPKDDMSTHMLKTNNNEMMQSLHSFRTEFLKNMLTRFPPPSLLAPPLPTPALLQHAAAALRPPWPIDSPVDLSLANHLNRSSLPIVTPGTSYCHVT